MEPSRPTDRIRVEQLEVFARVGVTESERASPQRLVVTITVWLEKSFESMNDDITQTVNYSGICVEVSDFVRDESHSLIETLVARMAAHLLKMFPIRKVEIELRKFVLPDAKYAAVIVTREKA